MVKKKWASICVGLGVAASSAPTGTARARSSHSLPGSSAEPIRHMLQQPIAASPPATATNGRQVTSKVLSPTSSTMPVTNVNRGSEASWLPAKPPRSHTKDNTSTTRNTAVAPSTRRVVVGAVAKPGQHQHHPQRQHGHGPQARR